MKNNTKLSIPTLSLMMDLLNKEHTKRLHNDDVLQALYKEGKDKLAKQYQKEYEANPHHPFGKTWKAILEVQKQMDEYDEALNYDGRG